MSAIALRSPYKGLAPFEDSEQDALFFFGRERECEVVVANMLASKLTVLYGPSGVGKSSMLRAAVARRLRELAPEADVGVLSEWAGEALLPRPFGEAYLILDQFEEYFLYHGEGALLDELPDLLAQPRVHVLISLRDDALSRLDAFQARIPNVFANRLPIDHLDREAARAAIVGPIDRWNELAPKAERAGIEAALVGAVLDEVAAAPGNGNGANASDRIEAPYLQLVMERVWEEEHAAGSSFLRAETLERLGGARAIVSAHLERTLGTLSRHDAAIAASALTYLVTPSRTKIAQSFDDLVEYTDRSPAELRAVLELLAAQRILRAASDESRGGRRYEVFHDVLAEPVLSWRRAFVTEAALTAERERAAKRHRRLTVVAVGAGIVAAAMIALTAFAFAQRSEASKQRRAAERTTQYALGQKRIAQNAKETAQEQRRRAIAARHRADAYAKAEQQSAQQAQQSQAQAEQSNEAAQASAASANTSAQQAQKSKALAVREQHAAQKQAQQYKILAVKNHVGELVATAKADLTVDPMQSVQAAFDASALSSSDDVEDTLRSSLQMMNVRAVLDGGGGVVNVVAAFSPDGSLVATGTAGGSAGARRTSSAAAGHGGILRVFQTATHRLVESEKLGSAVSSIAFAPDGELLAVGTTGGSTDVYDLRTKKLVQTLPDDAGVLDVVFADHGREVLTGSTDKTFRIWSASSGSLLQTIAGARPVQTVATNLDGSLAAVVLTGDPVIRVYSIPSGKLVAAPPQTGEATDAAFSPDGKYLATTGRRNGYVWDTTTWQLLHLLVGHEAAINDVVFAPDDRVVTSSVDSSVRVWSPTTGDQLASLLGQSQQKMLAVAVSPDNGQIAAAGADPIVRIWATPLGAIPRPLAGHTDSVTSVSYNRDGSLLLTASADGTARLWDTTIPTLAPLGRQAGSISTVAYSADGKHVLSAGADGTAQLWTAGGGLAFTLPQGGAVNDATFTADGTGVLTAGQDGTAKRWDAATGVLRATFTHGAPVSAVVSAPGGGVVTAGTDGVVRAWASGGRPLWAATHGSPIAALAVASDGTVATGAADGTVRLWRGSDGSPLHPPLKGHTGPISSLAFSPSGDLLASGSADDTARLWNTRTGTLAHVLAGHLQRVTSVAFSPDGKLVATASVDGDAWLWHAATGTVAHKLRFHVSTVSQVAFSPDGRWVVTAGPSAAGLWETRTGGLFVYLHGALGNLTSAAWAPDSQRFVVGDSGGGVETYRCALCGGVAALQAQAKERLDEIRGSKK